MEFNSKEIRNLSLLGFSGTLGLVLNDIANINDEVYCLTSDLTFFSGLNRFSENHPKRFINVGIAEQNMVSIATGIASEGKIPFMTTYASFMCTRALDQIKVGLSYMNMPVIAVGLTSGFATGILGATHMCLEDIAIINSLPNITILQPSDALELAKILYKVVGYKKPVYIRGFGTGRLPIVNTTDYKFELGKNIKLCEGDDAIIFTSGTMVYNSIEVAKRLREDNIYISVVNVHTIKPLDIDNIIKESNNKKVFVIEEHTINGGLGSIISKVLLNSKNNVYLDIIAVNDFYPHAAEYNYLIELCGLSVKKIYEHIKKILLKGE